MGENGLSAQVFQPTYSEISLEELFLFFPIEAGGVGEFAWFHEAGEALFADDPCGIAFDFVFHAWRRQGAPASA